MGVIGGGVPGVVKFKESHIYRIYIQRSVWYHNQEYGSTGDGVPGVVKFKDTYSGT
jgi:hypothetical protein